MTDPVPAVALRTYMAIRIGVVAVILALAFAVWREIATQENSCIQRSLSAYYYTPVRPVFVGALLIIGFAMIVMWGKNVVEDASLNLAGLLLMVVALVPTLDANYCSLPGALPNAVPNPEDKQVSDNRLIALNAPEVNRSFDALMFTAIVVLVFIAGAVLWAYLKARSAADAATTTQPAPTRWAMVTFAITWALAAAAVGIYLALHRDAKDPDSAFNHQVHGTSANLAVAFIIVAVVSAAVDHARSTDTSKSWWRRWRTPWWDRWVWLYGGLALLMGLSAAVIKIGDHHGLFSGWSFVDVHATFVLEAIVIALLAVYWILQTIERRDSGAPTY